jgi:ferredoxin, 2Fe-2S
MVKIRIENLGQKEILGQAQRAPVLKLIHEAGVDWMHACGGKGRCTTCKMIILKGSENLSIPSAAEIKYREMGALDAGERLACQSSLAGEIVVRVPEEYKLPHLHYTS